MRKNLLRSAVAAALLAASAASNIAFAVQEIEPNDSIASAQNVTVGSDGSVEITAGLGALTEGQPLVADVDFYSFDGREGDVVELDIDFGWKATCPTTIGSSRCVDSLIAIFHPSTLEILTQNNDAASLDTGSSTLFDARIQSIRLPVTGRYLVGVSSMPRSFVHGGGVISTALHARSNGSYSLFIRGVTPPVVTPPPPPPVVTPPPPPVEPPPPPVVTPPPPPAPVVQQINIDIKPGTDKLVRINPKSRKTVLVALLSSAEFDALTVDRASLTFGANGNERSLIRCGKRGWDVDGNGQRDLVCRFKIDRAGFEPGDDQGILRGMRKGQRFEGHGWLKVVPEERKKGHHHHNNHHHHHDKDDWGDDDRDDD